MYYDWNYDTLFNNFKRILPESTLKLGINEKLNGQQNSIKCIKYGRCLVYDSKININFKQLCHRNKKKKSELIKSAWKILKA